MKGLNRSWLNKPIPPILNGIYDEKSYKKSQEYNLERGKFGIVSGTFNTILTLGLLYFGLFGWLWDTIYVPESSQLVGALKLFGILHLGSILTSLPFGIYSTFVIEEKYGFNKTTVKTYIKDKITGLILTVVVGGAILSVLFLLLEHLKEDYWIVFWLIMSALMLVMNMFYTSLIVPLFNKLTPLDKEADLRIAIEAYAKKINFPLDNIFVIDGSKRSSKANAYFSGIGRKKKIVLYDTLIENHSIEELVGVLAHEVGHFKKKHIIWSYFLGVIQMGVILYISSLVIFNPNFSASLGANSTSWGLNLLVFSFLFSPINLITGTLMNVLSRKNEFEADEFAKKTYGAAPLISALRKLSSSNLSNLTPHPYYVFMEYSHPPLAKRISALQKEV